MNSAKVLTKNDIILLIESCGRDENFCWLCPLNKECEEYIVKQLGEAE